MALIFHKLLLSFFFSAHLFVSGDAAHPILHPYHVSATEIEYNAAEKKLEISSRIFTDDFESVLKGIFKTKADFTNPAMKATMDDMVKKYITTHLAVRTNGHLLTLKLYGWEVERDVVYVYTTANAESFNIKNITVENTILYELFTDQMNIIHFLINGERKSSKLNYPDKKAQFSF